jgi:hypothetical protein
MRLIFVTLPRSNPFLRGCLSSKNSVEKKEEIYMDMLLKTPLNPMGKFKEKI